MGAMTTQPTDEPSALPEHEPEHRLRQGYGPAPLLLTLRLAEPAQSLFQALRSRHFPAARNVVPAHVSLFHALPGEARAEIQRLLGALQAERPAIQVEPPRSLGRGVAFPLASPELLALRASLAGSWSEWLTPQDRQRYAPHVTVQNKVTPEQARETLWRLRQGFVPWRTEGVELLLWRYLDGPWEAVARIALSPRRQPGD